MAPGALLLLGLLLSGRASADERQRLVILPSIVRGGLDAITPVQILESISPALQLRLDLETVTASELLTGTEDPVITIAEGCGADLACISERVRANGIQLALRVVVNHAVEPAVVSLHLIDARSAKVLHESIGEGVESIVRLAQQLFDDAGFQEGARLRVVVSPPDAEVTVEGSRALGPSLFLVEARTHHVEARKEGYLPAREEVVAARGADLRLALTLIEEPRSIVESPWLWIGVAAGVAVITGIVVFVVVDPGRPQGILVN